MKYVYPNNLMAHRNQRREALRGGLLFGFIVLLIACLFYFASAGSFDYNSHIVCTETLQGALNCSWE